MGLFKDFREDLSQAAKEMMPSGPEPEEEVTKENVDNLVVDTLGEDVDVKSELSKLDGLLEQVKEAPAQPKPTAPRTNFSQVVQNLQSIEQPAAAPVIPDLTSVPVRNLQEERRRMSDTTVTINQAVERKTVEDETSVITASTVLTGDIATAGSFNIQGTINGNVSCNGKLDVTGMINGNSSASEFFADEAKIEGEIVSSGTVKIGAGSVIIGNITAASAVIAGAVKGDIDVQGPVVVDTSAVIMGNIKSRSVQINNGAVIEGFCSQSYADVDVQGLFGV